MGFGWRQDQHEDRGQRDQLELTQAGTWDVRAFRGGQAFALPFTNVTALAPITANFEFHRQGDKPREMLDFEPDLVDLVQKYRSTFDAAGRKEIMSQYNNIHTQNVYNMGVFVGRYGLGLAKRSKNVPDGTPVFMYTWVEDAILLDAIWTPQISRKPRTGQTPFQFIG